VEAARTQRAGAVGRAARDARVSAMLARNGAALMRVARAASLCQDDAADAVQRALEIYVRRLDSVDAATEVAWLKVVVRHEAYAIRRARGETADVGDLDLDDVMPAVERSVEDRVLSDDRVSRSAAALRALKPDEARALMLKAHGLSYDEIGRHCGWSYTKVNRCITEGRRRFLEAYEALESGDACAAFEPALAALAAGRATSEQMLELRPHLRTCTACRATVRDLHMSGLRRVLVLGPIPALGWIADRLRGFGRHGHSLPADAAIPPDAIATPPDAIATPPDAIATPDLVAPRGADVPLPDDVTVERLRPLGRARHQVTELMTRAGNPDVTTGVQILAGSGAGRVAALGAVAGLCLSGIGAGTVCVVRGISPFDWLQPPHKPAAVHRTAVVKPTPTPVATVVVTPTPTPRTVVIRRHRSPASHTTSRKRVSKDPAQGRTPTSHRHAPISPAAPATTSEFAAAPSSGTGTSAPPAAAPATGGSEFGP
jgi:RNA polymerase sigma factor (sigma-70 family)